MAQLAEVCHHGHRAILASHHAKKSDGHYRDSTAIGANADLLLEMFPDEADPNVRRFSPMGRMTLEPFALGYTGSGFDQVGGHVAVRDRVLSFVEANAGSSKRRIREVIQGSNSLVDQALDQLARDGLIVDHGTESKSQFNVTENGRGTVAARYAARSGEDGETQWGTVSARYRHGDGHRPCPVPLRVYGAPRSFEENVGDHNGPGTPSPATEVNRSKSTRELVTTSPISAVSSLDRAEKGGILPPQHSRKGLSPALRAHSCNPETPLEG